MGAMGQLRRLPETFAAPPVGGLGSAPASERAASKKGRRRQPAGGEAPTTAEGVALGVWANIASETKPLTTDFSLETDRGLLGSMLFAHCYGDLLPASERELERERAAARSREREGGGEGAGAGVASSSKSGAAPLRCAPLLLPGPRRGAQ